MLLRFIMRRRVFHLARLFGKVLWFHDRGTSLPKAANRLTRLPCLVVNVMFKFVYATSKIGSQLLLSSIGSNVLLERLHLNFRRILLNQNLATIQNEGKRDVLTLWPIQGVISEVLLHWSTGVKKMSRRSSALHLQQHCNLRITPKTLIVFVRSSSRWQSIHKLECNCYVCVCMYLLIGKGQSAQ